MEGVSFQRVQSTPRHGHSILWFNNSSSCPYYCYRKWQWYCCCYYRSMPVKATSNHVMVKVHLAASTRTRGSHVWEGYHAVLGLCAPVHTMMGLPWARSNRFHPKRSFFCYIHVPPRTHITLSRYGGNNLNLFGILAGSQSGECMSTRTLARPRVVIHSMLASIISLG
jgi:hypothetical protein